MIFRHDQITVDLPAPNGPTPTPPPPSRNCSGGKFGEMSTLMNYTFQSFNFRGKKNFRPFYDLISNIAAEEYSHIEAVTAAINLLLTGTTPRTDRNKGAKTGGNVPDPTAPEAQGRQDQPRPAQGSSQLPQHLPFPQQRPTGAPDGFHGPFLDRRERVLQRQPEARPAAQLSSWNAARAPERSRAYESTDDPCARAMIGYLLVRGGTHVVAYAKALEVLTGANVGALLPIPDVSNRKFPEARKLEEEQGLHLVQYHQSKDYTQIAKIWNGPHPEDGKPLVVKDEMPKGYPWPILDDEPQLVLPERHRPGHDQVLRRQARLNEIGDFRGAAFERTPRLFVYPTANAATASSLCHPERQRVRERESKDLRVGTNSALATIPDMRQAKEGERGCMP